MGRFLDPFEHPERVADLLARHGDMSEHHAAHYACHSHEGARNALYVEDDTGCGALAQEGPTWNMLAEPLAPPSERPRVLLDVAREAFARGAASMTFEGRQEFLDAVRARAPSGWTFEEVRPYFWPVFDMATWDPALPGGRFRDLRNKLNRFHRGREARTVPAADVEPATLEALLDRWIGARERPEGVERSYYANGIRSGFEGFDHTRVVLVGGEPAALTAGWRVPNSDGAYYSAWGIYDYAHPGVGEFANWDDLVTLARAGHRTVDFGGSDKTLLAFKEKFGPAFVYETRCLRVSPG